MRKVQLLKFILRSHYLKLVLASIILPALFVGSCLYYLVFTILEEELGIPEAIAEHLIPAIHKIDSILLIGLPLLMIILTAWGFMLSTKLVGPIARMEKEIKAIAESGYSRRINLRKNDTLKPIAEGINSILDKVEELQKK